MRGPVPPVRIYIHVLLHRLGVIAVNHFNQPYRVVSKVLGLVTHEYTRIVLRRLWKSVRMTAGNSVTMFNLVYPKTVERQVYASGEHNYHPCGRNNIAALECIVQL